MASYFAAIFTDLERHSEAWTRIPRDRMVAIIAEYRYLAEKCFCLFEGPSEDAVRQANVKAEIPFDSVVEALHIASEDLS